MLVYRIETEDGDGPYGGAEPKWGLNKPYCGDRHPTPEDDSKLRDAWIKIVRDGFSSDWRFGFTSVDQMRAWFYEDDWLVAMHDIGLGLVVYGCSTDEVRLGHTQAVFERGRCDVVERHALTEYVSDEVCAASTA